MIIKTKNFILRPFKMSDAEDIAKNINDKIISRNTATIPYPYTLKDAKWWLNKRAKRSREKHVNFAIVIDGEVGGSVGLNDIEKGYKAEVGYWLARKHWGKGIMPEAVKVIVDFGFKKLKLKRIWAGVYSFNPPSKRVLEKNGFKLEGTLIKDVKKGNKLFDKYILAKVK